jgi:hypothetical protein
MITNLQFKTPQNAERGIETGIPLEADSRISNGKRARIREAAPHHAPLNPRARVKKVVEFVCVRLEKRLIQTLEQQAWRFGREAGPQVMHDEHPVVEAKNLRWEVVRRQVCEHRDSKLRDSTSR